MCAARRAAAWRGAPCPLPQAWPCPVGKRSGTRSLEVAAAALLVPKQESPPCSKAEWTAPGWAVPKPRSGAAQHLVVFCNQPPASRLSPNFPFSFSPSRSRFSRTNLWRVAGARFLRLGPRQATLWHGRRHKPSYPRRVPGVAPRAARAGRAPPASRPSRAARRRRAARLRGTPWRRPAAGHGRRRAHDAWRARVARCQCKQAAEWRTRVEVGLLCSVRLWFFAKPCRVRRAGRTCATG